MSGVYFAGDAHFGQRPGSHFRKEYETQEDVESAISENWKLTINKRDVVYCTGDWVLSNAGLEKIRELPGVKILVGGNHDKPHARLLLEVFDNIIGMTKYKNQCWVTHCPMHPQELYNKFNVHGHIHYNTILDINYVNVCMENIGYTPIKFQDILNWREEGDPTLSLSGFNNAYLKICG